MLLRHAKAVPADGKIRDRDRPLAPRGQKDAPKIGAYMARHRLLPDRALVSPSRRTRETWELLSPVLGKRPSAVYEERLFDAPPQTILDVIQETGTACPTLLVIGHNPSLHRVAVGLIAAGDLDAREQLRENLPTSGLVIIEFPFDDWRKLHAEAGRISHFVTPDLLEAATD
ncbi:MAG TPA: histidine phosphatase family protein [Xanthobacteraceae bacterium]|nr:histidine phosphatase family protein [Xanthobacteraceae bacterium]